MDFGILNSFKPQEIARLAKNDVDFHLRWLMQTNHYEAIADNPVLQKAAKQAFFENEIEFRHRWYTSTDSVIALEALTELLRPQALAALFSDTESTMAAYVILGRGYAPRGRELLERVRRQYENGVDDPLESFTLFVMDLVNKNVDEWQHSLAPWATLVDRGLDEAHGSYTMVRTAMMATASRAKATAGAWDENGFTATRGLVSRLFFARHKDSDADWWRARLTDVTTETASQCLMVLLSWGAPDVIVALKADIDSAIQGLSPHDWGRLWSMTSLISRVTREHRAAIPEDWFQAAGDLSSRMALMLIGRAEDGEATRRLSRNYFMEYAGDDTQILKFATQIELMVSEEESIDWNHVQHLSMRAQQMGIRQFFRASRSLSSRVPEAVAKAVLSDCEKHSGQLVMLCEQAYATSVAQAASKVSYVAETDDWFVAHN